MLDHEQKAGDLTKKATKTAATRNRVSKNKDEPQPTPGTDPGRQK